MTKYCTSSSYGTVDNKTTLELTDDAARVNWGGNWRMPTEAEQDELRNTSNCTWIWTTQNGVNGYKVTSKKNGNYIFLPATGSRDCDDLYDAGSNCFYWSSSLRRRDNDVAYVVHFNSSGLFSHCSYRCSGEPVRYMGQTQNLPQTLYLLLKLLYMGFLLKLPLRLLSSLQIYNPRLL